MKFLKASNLYYLNRDTYIKLRWIAYIGQLATILFVQFYLNFKFNYFACILIILISVLTNFYLEFKFEYTYKTEILFMILMATSLACCMAQT